MRLGRPHIVAGGRGRAAGNAQAEVQQNATLACLQRIKMTEMASRFPRSHLKLGRSSMTLSGRVRGVILLGVAALAWPAKPQAPANARPFLDAGVSDLKRGDPHAAERELLEAANLDPGNPQTYNLLGFICDQTGRSDQSVRYHERALTLAPTFSSARNNLGNLYLREGKTSLAIEQFQQTLRLRPDDLTANYNLGPIELQKGAPASALTYLEKARSVSPADPAVLFALARGYFSLDRSKEALNVALQFESRAGQDVGAWLTLGASFSRIDNVSLPLKF